MPEGFEIVVTMENGCGTVKLYTDSDEVIDGDDLDNSDMEKQIIELVKLAKEEPSEFDI